ncbi:ASCH/PUA domain-containing protein [Carnobacterium maltaromaticum]|uniref:ASCH/PUA domain-containing protein n=1 Tax=Carnobacterium maltaromaticum TaxID=2751 RepID=A0AAW9JV81_CARML|nr:ASCH/PUA domain-containing protein [Carnobacterium maltaromaticum]MDZ5757545.1 ASCH/PUA domain-containing protein [Carnobacterium maltaromaticum]
MVKVVTIHELKIAPCYYEEVIAYRKTFEIRKNDRDFQVGDRVLLKEYINGEYTGRSVMVKITYLTDYEQKKGYCVFSISSV